MEQRDLKPDYYDTLEKMEKLRAAVGEYDRFQQLMRQHNRYDFDDMINWVLKAFDENKNLLLFYQERFQYILVDEYQEHQRYAKPVGGTADQFTGKAQCVCSGDDDQSIIVSRAPT
jgi:DNA helicase-2/ATP-dependent DNA helicase PcrA